MFFPSFLLVASSILVAAVEDCIAKKSSDCACGKKHKVICSAEYLCENWTAWKGRCMKNIENDLTERHALMPTQFVVQDCTATKSSNCACGRRHKVVCTAVHTCENWTARRGRCRINTENDLPEGHELMLR